MSVRTLAVVILAALAGFGLVFFGSQFISRPYAFQGSPIDPPVEMADFVLQDQNGRPFRLLDQQGEIVLLFFGYTFCPDVCPATLQEYKRVKEALGDSAERVRFVFITVDPHRDSPEQLAQHLDRYDPDIVGLTGTEAELEPVWKAFFVYRTVPEGGLSDHYLVDHTARIYVIDPAGALRLTFPFGMQAEAMAQDVLYLLAGN